jgi:hypothetical protein
MLNIRKLSGAIGLLGLTTLTFACMAIAPYFWAVHLESQWQPANPKSKAELESYLSLYSQHDIQPQQSEWGRNYQLQPGERMIQYRLLYKAPLDVVYAKNDQIVRIYTSYE